MPWISALINFGSDVYKEEQQHSRQEDSQHFNAAEAAVTRDFNSAQAVAQRDWTERMDNTKFQRMTGDMRNAGLNPMLSFGQHPTTPSGAVASGGQASAGIAGSPGSKMDFAASMATASQIEVNKAQADKLGAEADEARERTKNYDPQRREIEAKIPMHEEQVNLMKQQIGESAVRIEKIWEEVTQVKASAANITQQTKNLIETVPLIKSQIAQLRALAAKESAETDEIKQRIKANLPGLERTLGDIEVLAEQMKQPNRANQERAADSFTGQLGAYLREINPLQGFIGVTPGRRHTTIHQHGVRR